MLNASVSPRRQTGSPCSVGSLLERLGASEATVLRDWLGSNDWSARAIFEAVTTEGHTIGLQSIGRHRRGECRCGR